MTSPTPAVELNELLRSPLEKPRRLGVDDLMKLLRPYTFALEHRQRMPRAASKPESWPPLSMRELNLNTAPQRLSKRSNMVGELAGESRQLPSIGMVLLKVVLKISLRYFNPRANSPVPAPIQNRDQQDTPHEMPFTRCAFSRAENAEVIVLARSFHPFLRCEGPHCIRTLTSKIRRPVSVHFPANCTITTHGDLTPYVSTVAETRGPGRNAGQSPCYG